jgi:hypothetical protein
LNQYSTLKNNGRGLTGPFSNHAFHSRGIKTQMGLRRQAIPTTNRSNLLFLLGIQILPAYIQERERITLILLRRYDEKPIV